MKKALSLILTLVMCLSVCACENNNTSKVSKDTSISKAETTNIETEANTTLSKEEMMNVAIKKTTSDAINADIGGNKAKAKTYIDNSYIITGRVREIEEDYCVVKARKADHTKMVHFGDWKGFDAEFELHVYLPSEELINVKSASDITFVGMVTDIGSKEDNHANILYLDISPAYLTN